MRSRANARHWALLAWVLLRLPVLAVLAALFRERTISLIERWFDIGGITELVIALLGTPVMRAVLFFALLGGLASLLALSERLRGRESVVPSAVAAVALVALTPWLGLSSKWIALFLAFVLAANLLPSQLFAPGRVSGSAFRGVALVLPGVAEGLSFRPFLAWFAEKFGFDRLLSLLSRPAVRRLMSALVPAALMAVLLFQTGGLVGFEQGLRMDSRVRKLASVNLNWIELDPSGRYLYVTGHGVERLRRYDAHAPTQAPLEADQPTGNAQGFGFDPVGREVFVHSFDRKGVLVVDADSMKLKRELSLPDLSPGDPWVVFDPGTETVTVISEADERHGAPFQILRRGSGEVIGKIQEDPGNVILNPTSSLLYVGYFRRKNGVRTYDLKTQKFVAEAPTVGRPDRLVFWPKADEVLVAFPMESRILRLSAQNLTPKGSIPTVFGVRTLTIDSKRGWLFCGSLATGALAIIDLSTQREIKRLYVSPWLRTIQVDPERQIAFVSAHNGLYELDYRNLH